MNVSTLDAPASPGCSRYGYFTWQRDTGVVGYGHTPEQALERAAEAMFALTGDLEHVRPERTLPVSFIETNEERALMRWLNLLIEASHRHGLLFCEFHLQREQMRWWGCATGQLREAAACRRLERARTDQAAVSRKNDGWEARCIVECATVPRTAAKRPAPSSDHEAVFTISTRKQ